MKRKRSILKIVCLLFGLAGLRALAGLPKPSELLVKCEGGPSGEFARAADAAVGGVTIQRFEAIGWHLVRLPKDSDGLAALRSYLAQPGVELAELNSKAIRRPVAAPAAIDLPSGLSRQATSAPAAANDPGYGSQWNLKAIGIEPAWKVTTGDEKVIVAIVDSGVDYRHPELAGNMWRNAGESGFDEGGRDKSANGIDDDGNGFVDDLHGANLIELTGDPMDLGLLEAEGSPPALHGTRCAGIIGAAGNNGEQLAGVNWRVRIMGLAIFQGDADVPVEHHISRALGAYDYIVAMKRRGENIRVVNNSFGFFDFSQALQDALAAAAREGILCVFAAGNDGLDMERSPWDLATTDLRNVLNVTGSSRADELPWYSNYGKSSVHLAAPGEDLPVLDRGPAPINVSGSSYACPQVAGVAALLCAARPSLRVEEMRGALLESVDAVPAFQGYLRTGGRLNAGRAIASLSASNRTAKAIFSSPATTRTASNAVFEVLFNKPMNRAAVEAAFEISPQVPGEFHWSADSRSFTYRPAGNLNRTNHTARIRSSARDADGLALDGNFDGVLQNSEADDYEWSFDFPPAYDSFAEALVLTGESGSVTVNNRLASRDPSDPPAPDGRELGATLWFRWTAEEAGWQTFSLTGTFVARLMGVFEGAGPANLRELGTIYAATPGEHRLSVPVPAGQVLSIVLGGDVSSGIADGLGSFTLRWSQTGAPVISPNSPTNGLTGQTITLLGTNFTGAKEVLLDERPLVFQAHTNRSLADGRMIITLPPEPAAGRLVIRTPHGDGGADFVVNPFPELHMQRSAGGLVFSWPQYAGDFVLEMSPRIGLGAFWSSTSYPAAPEQTPGRIGKIAPNPPVTRFFRLRAR